MGTGKLIVIEGACDGIGKTTQARLLKEHFKMVGVRTADHHFPTYYAYQGKGAEKYLAGEFGGLRQLSPYFVNNLYAYDRAITWRVKLESEFEKGKVILLDRYTTSSMIYQSALFSDPSERLRFVDYIEDFEYNKLGIKRPDLVFFLSAPFEVAYELAQARAKATNGKSDIHEKDQTYLRQAYDNAQEIAAYCKWQKINCIDQNGGMMSPEEIHQQIWQAVGF